MSALEWSLIDVSEPSSEAGPSSLRDLAAATLNAEFKTVLLDDRARSVLSTPQLYDALNLDTTSLTPPVYSEDETLLRLIVAVALLHAFVQVNWTGPDLDFSPSDVVPIPGVSKSDLNAASLPHLTLLGEPAYHLCAEPSLLLLSIRLFGLIASSPNPPSTLPWWLLRVHLLHLSLLDEPVNLDPTIIAAVQSLLESFEKGPDATVNADRAASLHLELGLLHHRTDQDKVANQEFLAAARASELEFELTGALGKKTKFQISLHSQLVLLAESRPRPDDKASATTSTSETSAKPEATAVPENLPLNDDTLLEETEFTKLTTPSPVESTSRLSHLDPGAQPPLHPLDQSLLLSLCLTQQNSSPSHGLTASQMMPFITRVLSHPRNWSVHTTALLLRSRLESTRSRTVERSTLQLAALIEQMPTSDSTPAERLRYFHQLPLPSKWEMERELAKRYLSLGVIRSALDIFTRLEMWEDAVGCLQAIEREVEAERIVRDLLEGKKVESELIPVLNRSSLSDSRRQKLTAAREAKLWCLLGDIALDSDKGSHDPAAARKAAVENYEKAWEVSGRTSSRAMRSIGSLHVSAKEYELAVEAFKKALEINPLYARTWFTVGVCFMQLAKWAEARDAFRRDVGVDGEDSEGWNNLAAVYLRLDEEGLEPGQPLPPVSFENKTLAFRALRSGLRTAFNNWRMWQNYMIISIDVGELSEAARAMTRVVEEVASKDPLLAVDVDVLDKLVDSVTRDDWNDGNGPYNGAPPPTSNEGWGLLPIVERLFDAVILPRVSDNARVWRCHARLLRWKEDWAGAVEDYLRAYRASVANDERVERDLGRWKEAVVEIEELVDVLGALGPRAQAQAEVEAEKRGETKRKGDWKFQARGIVRTFIGRTKDAFEDQPEFEKLPEILDELKRSD